MNAKILFSIVLAFAFAFAQSGEKVLVIHYLVNDDGITETESSIVYGLPPNLQSGGGEFIGQTFDSSGNPLTTFSFYDPRMVSGDDVGEDGVRKHVDYSIPEAELVLVVPFTSSVAKMDILNASDNRTLVSTDTSKPVADFCKANPTDTDCTNLPKPSQGGSCMPAFGIAALVAALYVRRA